MRIDVLTLFPEMFHGVFGTSILKRASEKGLLEFYLHNIRDYSASKHKNTDDYPFGGGAGMVMMAQPVFDCLDAVVGDDGAYCIYMSPKGRVLNQSIARELSEKKRLVLLCGHYEGIDERIMTKMDDEISIGDYVLTGGELPAMVLVDCISRMIGGVLGSSESAEDESFSYGLLEYPQYTRPSEFRGMSVPEVLLNGNHAHIEKWRREQSLLMTAKKRPELLKDAQLTQKEREFLKNALQETDNPL